MNCVVQENTVYRILLHLLVKADWGCCCCWFMAGWSRGCFWWPTGVAADGQVCLELQILVGLCRSRCYWSGLAGVAAASDGRLEPLLLIRSGWSCRYWSVSAGTAVSGQGRLETPLLVRASWNTRFIPGILATDGTFCLFLRPFILMLSQLHNSGWPF